MSSRPTIASRSDVSDIQRSILVSVAAVAFGVLTVIGLELGVRIPLYTPLCAPCQLEFVRPTIAVLPLFVLILGAGLAGIYAALTQRKVGPADLVRGLSSGLVAALAAALIPTASVPFSDPYIGLPYRAYAVAVVLVLSLLGSWWLARSLRRGPTDAWAALFAMPVLATLTVAALNGLARGSAVVGAAAATGVVAGIALAWLGPAERWRALAARVPATYVVVGVMIVAFLVRVAFGLQALVRLGPGKAFALASDDGPAYYGYAHAIYADPSAAGVVLSNSAGYPPLYSFFLAGIFAATGESLAVVIVIQALLASAATGLVYLLARDLAGPAAGLVAAALFALSQNLVQSQATLTTEAVLVPLVLGALYAASRYRREGAPKWIVATAVLLALAFITRNMIFLLSLAVLAWLLVHGRGRPLVWLRDAALVFACTLVAAAPVLAATAQADGRPRLTNQLAQLGWSYEYDTGITIENGYLTARGIDPTTDPFGSAARVVADPLPVLAFFAEAVPQRISALLFFPNIGFSSPLVIVNPAVYETPFGRIVEFVLVVALAVGAAWLLRHTQRRRSHLIALLALYFVLYIAFFALVFPPRQAYRYRVPIEPVMHIAQAVGLVVATRYVLGAWRSAGPVGASRAPAPGIRAEADLRS